MLQLNIHFSLIDIGYFQLSEFVSFKEIDYSILVVLSYIHFNTDNYK